ncbi:MAG: hypothetical protein AB7M93_26130 [Candidatus Obscuribacterales bacterium]
MIRKTAELAIDRTQADYRYLIGGFEREILKARKAMSQFIAQEKRHLFFTLGRQIYDFRQAYWVGNQNEDIYKALAEDFREFFVWLDQPTDQVFRQLEGLYRSTLGIELSHDFQMSLEVSRMMASGFLIQDP